jgi:hypothetical protein
MCLLVFWFDDRDRSRTEIWASGPGPDLWRKTVGRRYSTVYVQTTGQLSGRYWDRTSDLFGVNEALSR